MRREPAVPVALAGAAAFLTLYATQPLLPLLARTFDASTFKVGLTVTAPTVAVALAAPAVGRFADVVGLRRVIVGSAFLLTVTTALSAASTTLEQLVFWRLMQGVVTPGIFAGTVAYIHETWPASRTGRATAVYMTGTIVGGFVGRALAGVIAADANWHFSFAALAVVHLAIALALWVWLPSEPLAPLKRRVQLKASYGARRLRAEGASRASPKLARFVRERRREASAERYCDCSPTASCARPTRSDSAFCSRTSRCSLT